MHHCKDIPAFVTGSGCRSMCIVPKLYLPLLQAVDAEQYAPLQRYTCLCYRQWLQSNVQCCEFVPAFVTGSGCKTMHNAVQLYLAEELFF